MKELRRTRCGALRPNTSGSLRRSQASFGPTAWLESSVPAAAAGSRRRRMRAVSSAISRVARVSMPYRMAGRSGRSRASAAQQAWADAADAHAATTDPTAPARSASLQMSQTSRHQIGSASTSAQPGRGNCIEWDTRLGGQYCTGWVDEKPLRAPGAHVDSQ